MIYTCAYFPRADATLEEAQIAKLDLVCRKLRLTPGEIVFEAGCGWGALALHMARNYGVTVRAFNISHEQILFARERAAREGISNVEFVEDDYRAISGHCDAFVSVGMLEHVGTRHYEALGRVMDRTLGPDGRGLLHFIGRNQPRQLNRWIRRHIFPDAYAPTLDEVCAGVLRPANFSVLDVENLRLHYALTLRHWRERFEKHEPAVREQYGAEFVRTWRMYLAGSEASFVSGSVQLFQILFARGETNRVHWTRDWLTGGKSA
jgi:cyclopropane-fatty-acyl-phospholipid synthase